MMFLVQKGFPNPFRWRATGARSRRRSFPADQRTAAKGIACPASNGRHWAPKRP